MKKEFTSTDSYRADGRNPFSLVEPDIAGHEARQALYRKKRINVAIISVVLCLVVIASAVFALYTATDLFKAKDTTPDLVIDKDENGIVKTTAVNLASFEAVKDGNYSAFSGIDVSEITEIQPFLIGYRLVVEDESVVKVINGTLYGLRPGVAEISVYSQDGRKVNSFVVQVLDENGRLYYDVTFEYPNSDPVVYKVISGRTLNQHELALPSLPSKVGYVPAYWMLEGERFFTSEVITEDITLTVKWNAVAVIFNTIPNLSGEYIEFFEHDLSQYAGYGSGEFEFEAVSTLPSGMTLENNGRLVGYPTNVRRNAVQEVISYTFDVKVIDTINDTADITTVNFKVLPKVVDIVFSGYANLTYNGGMQTISAAIQNLAIEDAGQVAAVVSYGANSAAVKNAGSYTATVTGLTGARAHCYVLPAATVSRSFAINPYPAEIRFYSSNINDQNFNLIYNAKPQTISAEVINLFDGDVAPVILGYSKIDAERIAVQSDVVASVLSIENPNYIIKDNQPNRSFNIVKAELAVTVNAATKVYNKGADPVVSFDIEGAQADIEGRSEEDMLRNILKTCVQRAAGENVGSYALTINPAVSSDDALDNYDITVTASTLTIIKRSVSVVASGEIAKTYDGTDTVNAAVLALAGENATDSSGRLTADAAALSFTARYEDVNAADDIAVIITLTGEAKNNYALTGEYTGRIDKFGIATLEIISASNKTYDNTYTAAVNVKAKGVGGIDIPLKSVSAAFENLYAGTHNITLFAAEVDDAYSVNYYVTGAALSAAVASANILPRPVYINTSEVSFVKTYDATPDLSFTINFGAFVQADAASGIIDNTALRFTGSYADASAGIGKALLLALDPATNPHGNYILLGAYTGTIDKKSVTLSGAVSKVYDTTTDLPAGLTVSGLVAGDEADVEISGSYLTKSAGEDKPVTLSLTGPKAGNYNLVFGGKGRITPETVTLTGNFNKIYDGTTIVYNIVDLLGVYGGDDVDFAVWYSSKNAGDTTINVQLSGTDASNYAPLTSSYAATIAKATVVVSGFTAVNKVYDGTVNGSYSTVDISGLIPGDDVTVNGITPKFADKNVGDGKVVTVFGSGLSLSGIDSGNYNIDTNNITSYADITPAPLTLTGSFDKYYDGTTLFNNLLTLNGVVAGDYVDISVSYASSDAEEGVAVNGTLTGTDSGNYYLDGTYTGTIVPRLVFAGAVEKIYDGTTDLPAVTFTNAVPADEADLTLIGSYGDKTVGNSKAVNLTLSGAKAGNYELVFGGTGKITALEISVSGDFDKTYDATTAFNNVLTINGVLGGDTVGYTAAYANKTAGATTVTVTLTGADAGNYILEQATFAAVIDKAALTLSTSESYSKIYDGTTAVTNKAAFTLNGVMAPDLGAVDFNIWFESKNAAPEINLLTELTGEKSGNYELGGTYIGTITAKTVTAITGVVVYNKVYDGTDSVSVDFTDAVFAGKVAGDSLTITGYTVSFDSANAGSRTATFSDIELSGSNYKLPAGYTFTGQAVIYAKEVTVSGNFNKYYDGTADVISALTVSGAIGGETVTATAVYSGGANAGTSALIFTLSSSNYKVVLTYYGTISPAEVTAITGITVADKIYDGTTAVNTASVDFSAAVIDGVVGSVTVTSFAASYDAADIGTRTVTLTDITFSGGNYYYFGTVSVPAEITARPITVVKTLAAADHTDKTYDGDALVKAGAFELSGVLSGESVTLTGEYNNKNAGEGKQITFAISGDHADNYYLANAAAFTGKILEKTLTVTGTFMKTYDGNKVLPIIDLSIDAIADDDVTISAATFDSKNAGTREITFTLAGDDAANYIAAPVSGTINKADLAIDPGDGHEKVYDGTPITLSVAAYAAGLVAGDTISGTIASAGENVGIHAFVPSAITIKDASNLSVADNYNLTVSDARTAEITPKDITVSVTAANKVYDGTTAATITFIFNGVIAGDTVAANYDTVASGFVSSDWGNGITVNVYDIAISGDDAGNYNLTNDTASTTADITKKTVSVIKKAGETGHGNKVYDGNEVVNASLFELAGVLAGETLTLTGTYDSKNAGDNKQITFAISGDDAVNYTLTNGDAFTGRIQKMTLTVTGTFTKTYDGNKALPIIDLSIDAIAGDDVTISAATFDSKNAGTREITFTLAGDHAANYIAAPVSGTINKADLAIDPGDGHEKVYDRAPLTLSVSAYTTGLVVGDTITGTIATEGYTVGEHSFVTSAITIKDGSGVAVAENYNINIDELRKAEITKKDISVSVTAANKVYDGTTNAAITFIFTGLVAGDTVYADYDAANSGFDTPDKASNKPVTVTGIVLTGAAAANYNLTNDTADTTASITAVIIDTITGFTANSKVYDGTTAAVVNSENITYYSVGNAIPASLELAITVSGATFDNANQGVGKKVTIPIENLTTVGAGWQNYELAPNVAVRYSLSADILATITQRVLYIDMNLSDFDKVYNGNNRVDVGNIVFAAADATTGVIAGDTVVLSSDSYYNTVWVESDIVMNFILTNNAAGNYVLAPQVITGNILRREVNIKDFATYDKTYDGNTTVLATLELENVVSGDILTVSGVYNDKNAGVHNIVFSISGGRADNYELTTVDTTGEIFKKVLRITDTTDEDNEITMVYTGLTTYSGEFEEGVHYAIDSSINAEAVTITIVSKTFNSPYVTEVSTMTAVFKLVDGNPINDNYLLETVDSTAGRTVSLIFAADITQKTNYSVLTIGAGPYSYGLDENHTAEFTSNITGFGLNFDHGTTPVGLNLQGDISVYELLPTGAPEDAVDFNGTTLYKSAPINSVASVYQIGTDASGTTRIFYVANNPANPICYQPIAPGQPNYEAYMSVRQVFENSFIVIHRP